MSAMKCVKKSTSSPERQISKGRKGHRKSRQGCFNCKQRKIKCQETLPECANCTRLSLRCQYLNTSSSFQQAGGLELAASLNLTPDFSLTDLRLFQHYLVAAHPHFPVACEDMWLSYVTPISHQSPFLMHSLLGLSAAHLGKLTTPTFTAIAQHHRLKASRGLNEALATPITSVEEGDAIIAACHALLMQSWYMDDGLNAFLTLTRSSQLVPRQLRHQKISALLAKEDLDSGVDYMKVYLNKVPSFNSSFVLDAVSSLSALRPLCAVDYQRDLQALILENFLSLCHTASRAYKAHASVTKYLVDMSHQHFLELCDAKNTVCQLLIAHLVALYMVMRPISCQERKKHVVTMYRIRMTKWIDQISQAMADGYEKYMEWPCKVSQLNQLGLKTLDSYILA